jgi:cation diffusion facilitator family transporter
MQRHERLSNRRVESSHAHGHGHSHSTSFDFSTRDGIRALKVGVAGLGFTTALQAGLLLLSGSVALLGDTLHNGVDVLGTGVVWIAFLITRREKNDRFGYGFHRIEDLAGLVVVLLIAGSAALVLFESFRAFGEERELQRTWLVLLAGLAGFVGNEAVAQYKTRTGKRIGSAALVADGQHSRADGLTSLGVVAAALGIMAGEPRIDAAFGLLIGLLIAWAACQTGRDVVLRLLDYGDPEIRHQLEHAAEGVEGLDHVNDLRVRHAGRTVHVVAHVCMPSTYDLVRAHDVAEALRSAWLYVLPPGSVVDIHADPYDAAQRSPHVLEPAHPH